ncbi:MAG TPA: DUF5985 family protein [Acidobacteriaceae bacterium]|jgi:hypothetical protein|nr:DUF5985 family protein [Acidobacteriaceae bacterium]
MRSLVYILNSVTFATCSTLLGRAYWRVRQRLLLWSALCFAGLAISNLLVFVDLVMLPQTDLYILRLSTAAVSMLLLMYGLIWESE